MKLICHIEEKPARQHIRGSAPLNPRHGWLRATFVTRQPRWAVSMYPLSRRRVAKQPKTDAPLELHLFPNAVLAILSLGSLLLFIPRIDRVCPPLPCVRLLAASSPPLSSLLWPLRHSLRAMRKGVSPLDPEVAESHRFVRASLVLSAVALAKVDGLSRCTPCHGVVQRRRMHPS